MTASEIEAKGITEGEIRQAVFTVIDGRKDGSSASRILRYLKRILTKEDVEFIYNKINECKDDKDIKQHFIESCAIPK